MRRRFLRWLAPLLIAGSCLLPAAAWGQDTGIERGVRTKPDAAATDSDKPERTGGPAYVVGVLLAILVLLPICMPSRKAQR
jgi:hypothetical protein